MCYEVKCSTCGKTSWGGCGRHVASVYKRVPEGQHCQCKEWPGIAKSEGSPGNTVAAAGAGDSKASGSSFCTIL
ncbi:hypothetical protein NMG60_11016593 [Bertholletia excelsa]